MPEKTEPIYTSPDRRISFIENPRDGPGTAYWIRLNDQDSVYMPEGILADLTHPTTPTEGAIGKLEAVTGGDVRPLLRKHNISPEQLQIALLHLRIIEQEEEIRYAFSLARP